MRGSGDAVGSVVETMRSGAILFPSSLRAFAWRTVVGVCCTIRNAKNASRLRKAIAGYPIHPARSKAASVLLCAVVARALVNGGAVVCLKCIDRSVTEPARD